MRRAFPVLVLLALATFAACGRGTGAETGDQLGTISGSVLLAPTCPVQSTATPCPPRPLAGVPVRVEDDEGNVAATGVSDQEGAFTLEVAPGSYLLTASIEEDPARSVQPVRVEVRAGEVVRSDVLVDSGIR